MRPLQRIGAAMAALMILVASLAFLAPAIALTFPALTGRIVDQANIIPADKQAAIEPKLADLERDRAPQAAGDDEENALPPLPELRAARAWAKAWAPESASSGSTGASPVAASELGEVLVAAGALVVGAAVVIPPAS